MTARDIVELNNSLVKCPDCAGYGEHGGSHSSICWTCNGYGKITKEEHELIQFKERELSEKKELRNKIADKLYYKSIQELKDILGEL